MFFLKFIYLLLLFVQINGQAFHLKFLYEPEKNHSCLLIEDDFLPKYRGFSSESQEEFKVLRKPPLVASSENGTQIETLEIEDDEQMFEIFARKQESAMGYLESKCRSHSRVPPLELTSYSFNTAQPEIRKLVDGGDQMNRIDVVFMGDGYTASEKEQFFTDIQRLTHDMFEGVTFSSYLPLFNIWAIYVESPVSGIGYDGPKNTPFELYRVKGQLRVIYAGNDMYARQVCALTGPSGCDYPSLIANDNFYGGVGGEFVISTKSERTGTFVLRHEMGHNFANVGDEYDNSYAYFGANSAKTVESLRWTHWLSTQQKREEKAIYRLLEYPWADLKEGEKSFTFTSDGTFQRWELVLSVSAAGEEDCLEFTMDGNILPWKTTGFDDREFYNWTGSEGFSAGSHTFTVRSKTNSTNPDIPRMICSIILHEMGGEDEFVADNNHISAYPTWDDKKEKTLRPTNAGCLMRHVTIDKFCPVCKESMWLEFLQRVSLIDEVEVSDSSSNGTRSVTLNTLKLGGLRQPGRRIQGEKLEVKWFLNNTEQSQFRDQFSINAVPGIWIAEVHFVTPEVRHDPAGVLTSKETVLVPPI